MRGRWWIVLLFLLTANLSQAEFRFPMPEFSSGYTYPAVRTPEPENQRPFLDVIALAGALVLASYLVLKRRSRAGIYLLTIFSVGYFGFWRKGCVCSVGSVQNVAAGLFHSDFGVPAVVMVFFALPLLFALFFGRVFCAAVCPLGAIQELVAVKPVRLPQTVEKALGFIPYIYLGLAVLSVAMGAGFIICQYDPFVGFFRLGAGFDMLLVGSLLLVLGVFVARPYCRFLCPYGVLLGWMSRFSKYHASVTPSFCTQCRLCEDACPYNAIAYPSSPPSEPREKGMKRLAILLLVLPLLIAAGAGAGTLLREPLSRLHPKVRLAERLAGEELGRYREEVIETETFRASEQPAEDLYREVQVLKAGFARGGAWLGAFLGLVLGSKLIAYSLVRVRTDYEPDRGACLSCGRCYKYCPVLTEQEEPS